METAPKAKQEPGESPGEKEHTVALNQLTLEVLSYLVRASLCLIPVYLVGYLGFSVSWVLIGLFLWMWWKKNKNWKQSRLAAAYELLEDEVGAISRGLQVQQLPAWVHFPDVERVEWLNKILGQVWPYFGMYMEKMFQEQVEPSIRGSNIHLRAFTFTKLNFGEKAPRIHGVKVYTKQVDKREVILDLQICYIGDCEINVEVKKLCKAGVKGIQIHGTLRVILAPLLSQLPFVGAVTMFFIQKPHLEINWTGLTNLLEIPGVSDMSDDMIVNIIASYLVLPNRFTIPLSNELNVAQLRFPLPHGVLRVHVFEAEDLIPKDTYLRGIIKGKSDPYTVVRVGTQMFRTKTIKENLNPKWHEMFEFVVHEVPGQDLEVDLYDEDPDKDDFLGSLLICLGGVMEDRVVDEWFPLSDVASGQVHLKLEWFSLVTDQAKLCESTNGLSTAMLIVYLDCAYNLPNNYFDYTNNQYSTKKMKNSNYVKKMDTEPNPYALLTVGSKTMKSKIYCLSRNPVWEQAFAFFIQNVHGEQLHIEVKDDERHCALGILDIPVQRLLKDTDLTLDQKFQLENSGPDSVIKMKIVLRILCIEDPDPDSIYTGVNALKQGPISIRRTGTQSKHPSVSLRNNEAPKTLPNNMDTSNPETKPVGKESVTEPNKLVAEKNIARNAVQGTRTPTASLTPTPSLTPTASLTPNLRRLKKFAPSLASLNSVASSFMDASDLTNNADLNGVLLGEIQLTVRYASLRQSLIILVNGCRNLIQCSDNGADPYVRIYLLPERRWTNRKKTTVKKKTLNPQYDEKFEFFVTMDDVKKRSLDVAVKNHRSFGSHERKEMGKVLVDLSKEDLSKGFTQWFELTFNGEPRS
ncbi:extended synaptotagmin-3 [Microcaecilia unicolor]|uniref:Extended synaptotagmin-3 n=1 Tax=Microcaecilia unicolor TaxID=1415580 RepID=A0A6P7YRV6_9AMPH|nr:extended synaptotagmin-3-like [Microcaecilia unicolor]